MTNWKHRITIGASAAAIALAVLAPTGFGSSAEAASRGTTTPSHISDAKAQKFTFVTAGSTLHGKDGRQIGLFHGAINAGGLDVPKAQADLAKLPGGTITIKHPDSQSTFVPHVDQSTCYATFTIKGAFTLTHGTGRYAGVTGSGRYVGHGAGYLARNQHGMCNMHAEPTAEVFRVVGKGTLD